MKVKRAAHAGKLSNRVWEGICLECGVTLIETQGNISNIQTESEHLGDYALLPCIECGSGVKFFPMDEFDGD